MSETATEPTPAKTTKKVAYAWDDSTGKVTRTPEGGQPEHVATRLATGGLFYVGDGKNYAPGIAACMKKYGLAYEVMEVQPKKEREPQLDEPDTGTTTGTIPGQVVVATGDGLESLAPRVQRAVRMLRAKLGFPPIVETNAPKAPRQTTGAGDKTVEYVEWLLRYHPAKFAEVYGVMGMGSIEVVKKVRDEQTGKSRKVRERERGHVIARRMTHLTKRTFGPDDLDENE